jgi:hypothetical protein
MAGRAPVVPKNNRAVATPKEAQINRDQLPLEERIRQRAHEIYLGRRGEGSLAAIITAKDVVRDRSRLATRRSGVDSQHQVLDCFGRSL